MTHRLWDSRHSADTFPRSGLSHIIQKGPSIAKYYPKPMIRKSGDIDIYFPPGDFEKAAAMAEALTSPDKPESEPGQHLLPS